MQKNKIFFNLILILISALISLSCIEFFLIIKAKFIINYDTEMWKYSKLLKTKSENKLINHIHIKNKEAILQNVNIKINSLGLRGNEKDISEWNNAHNKILFIGSSITLGWGVEEAKTITKKLEHNLNSHQKNSWKILNGGVGNYNTQRYVVNYFDNYKKLKPNIIVIQYFLNDSEILQNTYGNIFTRNFHLATILWKYISIKKDNLKFSNIYDYYSNFYEIENFKNTKKYLIMMKNECNKNQIRCIIAYTPDIQFLNDKNFDKFENKIKSLTKQLDYEFVSFTNDLRKSSLNLKNGYNDNHPNEKAHEIMSQSLYKYLVN